MVILGAGESGTGAARLAVRKGYDVFVSDKGKIAEKYRMMLQAEGIAFEEGRHSMERILAADEVIKSPGIPESVPVLRAIREKGIPVVGELEFGFRHCHGKIIAITGSNGKSTTTKMTWWILHRAGLDVAMGGNIGKSFAGILADGDHDWYVLEVSSFMLDDTATFRPFIAMLLNITPDHLDRYAYQMENYVASKFRITANQNESDLFIYNADDPVIREGLKRHPSRAVPLTFTAADAPRQGAWISGSKIQFQYNQNTFDMTISELAVQGKHNRYNSMAAAISGHVLDIRKESIRESLMDFTGLEHRLEFVAKVHGISFINDSKATNVNSTWYALESMNDPVIWIAGGVDKGNDYSEVLDLVKKKVKAIVCLGTDNRKLQEAFSRHVDIMVTTDTMQEAVDMAYRLGKDGDAVLLSPACASFDLFENYEDRGNQFKNIVREL
ncbi:MAG: UDP-N-acetylmuramoyl-L-alanine--D-glutamate ligase [Chitinophagales bacterium]|mgnify:CR=1 FL=1|nr:UDP-N-acetylmuramoyl-L-alanine--D-glutamate ligase [Chitinophagales bacterium]HAE13313.1 UDP-N-acetylmuramoyl-L-alanine--D-glutamate ligase [Bacteroidota bacterium]MCB9031345.1 UDP-N-acetylmuramoyl-L-alanine--D-glutamate ligase [Chitinophagales bacterium]HAE35793.1 UDP-N-acetylmuramoyl-L-alanine--D-glutamate ligase [Bacteroidota bacterium]HPE96769.1 UDP-N-acetylmuramoyl-L-alanine--D-glutamate ligase [Chitinophagales bacterium]